MSRSAERIVSLLWLLLEAGANGRTKNDIFTYLYDHQNTSTAAKQRQFSRDKEALTTIGVPVEFDQHITADGVYTIDHDRLYLPDLELTDEEILALHQARALWMKTPIEDAIHTALARMTAGQPTSRPFVGAQLATGQSLLTDIVAATREQAPISFSYRTVGRQEITTRRLRPWAVFMVHQHWYVVGWDLDRGDERIFRLSRIESNAITVLPNDALTGQREASLRPEQFSIDAIRSRLYTEQTATEAYVWIAENVSSSLRVRADIVQRSSGWELLHFTYRDPLKVAASITALTTGAHVDLQRSPELAELVDDRTAMVRDAHTGASALSVPELTKVARTRRRTGDKDVISRRLGIVAVVNQNGGAMSREQVCQRFAIDDATLTEDLSAMQFWGMPETDFAGGQFEVDPHADPVEISNAELLAQPWRLSAPEALGLISGLKAVPTIPGISPVQQTAAQTLGNKLRDAIDLVDPPAGTEEHIVHPDLSLGEDDEVTEVLHHAARLHQVVSISYYSESSGGISIRDIEPLQLVYASGHGYVHAWCQETADHRTFRVDRIGAATMTDRYFDPARRRLPQSPVAPTMTDEAVTVIIHATHRYRDVISAYHPTATAIADDGSTYAQLAFQTLTPLLDLLATHAGQIIVVQPQEVREAIWEMTNGTMPTHQGSTR
ncbi:helix-turn-helix transcriptional regulator [Yaniella halotolerans]|uniref:helix-turn-helix transcriptional regulator n=1 Tax=Yaniella halotolerans TaxID=225453 RepID=UPI0003B5B94D|nr:WYL domain-containing protein [Yaniella halotolerans]